MRLSVTRYHDFSAGHRLFDYEGKCHNIHGHNYRVFFTLEAKKQDKFGMTVEFSVIKKTLCDWLEENWDHKLLLYDKDPLCEILETHNEVFQKVPFNPSVENMAVYLIKTVAPSLLKEYEAVMTRCVIEETRKCSVEVCERYTE